jgi:enamine deaminase RidA (YjgF/YER057c/UK114 family)
VVKINSYVTDMDGGIDEFVRQTKSLFSGGYPASTLVEVTRLAFPGQLVEMEAIAMW